MIDRVTLGDRFLSPSLNPNSRGRETRGSVSIDSLIHSGDGIDGVSNRGRGVFDGSRVARSSSPRKTPKTLGDRAITHSDNR